jgi:hypothetical protein
VLTNALAVSIVGAWLAEGLRVTRRPEVEIARVIGCAGHCYMAEGYEQPDRCEACLARAESVIAAYRSWLAANGHMIVPRRQGRILRLAK